MDSTSYSDPFTYSTGHVIASHTDRRGKTWSFTYNTDNSLASETDPLSHAVTIGYASGATTLATCAFALWVFGGNLALFSVFARNHRRSDSDQGKK